MFLEFSIDLIVQTTVRDIDRDNDAMDRSHNDYGGEGGGDDGDGGDNGDGDDDNVGGSIDNEGNKESSVASSVHGNGSSSNGGGNGVSSNGGSSNGGGGDGSSNGGGGGDKRPSSTSSRSHLSPYRQGLGPAPYHPYNYHVFDNYPVLREAEGYLNSRTIRADRFFHVQVLAMQPPTPPSSSVGDGFEQGLSQEQGLAQGQGLGPMVTCLQPHASWTISYQLTAKVTTILLQRTPLLLSLTYPPRPRAYPNTYPYPASTLLYPNLTFQPESTRIEALIYPSYRNPNSHHRTSTTTTALHCNAPPPPSPLPS